MRILRLSRQYRGGFSPHWRIGWHGSEKPRAGAGISVLTNDLDFPQILAYTRESGPSVVILRGEPLTPEVRGSALLQALRECESEFARLGAPYQHAITEDNGSIACGV